MPPRVSSGLAPEAVPPRKYSRAAAKPQGISTEPLRGMSVKTLATRLKGTPPASTS